MDCELHYRTPRASKRSSPENIIVESCFHRELVLALELQQPSLLLLLLLLFFDSSCAKRPNESGGVIAVASPPTGNLSYKAMLL